MSENLNWVGSIIGCMAMLLIGVTAKDNYYVFWSCELVATLSTLRFMLRDIKINN